MCAVPRRCPPLTADQIRPLQDQVRDWEVVKNHHLEREFYFPDFKSALGLWNKVGAIAENRGIPRHLFRLGKSSLTIWTHKMMVLLKSDSFSLRRSIGSRDGRWFSPSRR